MRAPAPADGRAPKTTTYFVVRRLATELQAQHGFTDEGDLVDACKWACARLRIDYGGHDPANLHVVQRACAAVWHVNARAHPRATVAQHVPPPAAAPVPSSHSAGGTRPERTGGFAPIGSLLGDLRAAGDASTFNQVVRSRFGKPVDRR